MAPGRWRMNKKDGRSLLLGAKNKKGFYTVKVDDIEYEVNKASAKACPMKIIRINKLNK
jgi:ferredoxin